MRATFQTSKMQTGATVFYIHLSIYLFGVKVKNTQITLLQMRCCLLTGSPKKRLLCGVSYGR